MNGLLGRRPEATVSLDQRQFGVLPAVVAGGQGQDRAVLPAAGAGGARS